MILLQYVAGSSLEIFTLLIIIIRSVEDLNDVTQIITLHVKDLSRNSKAFTTDLFIKTSPNFWFPSTGSGK